MARTTKRVWCLVLLAIAAALLWVGSALAERIAEDIADVWAAVRDGVIALATPSPRPHAALEVDAGPPDDAAPRMRAFTPPPIVAAQPPSPRTTDEVIDEIRAAFCPEAAARLCRAQTRCGCSHPDPSCAERVEAACSDHISRLYAAPTYTRRGRHGAAPPSDAGVPALELAPDALAACLAGFDALADHCALADAVIPGCAWPVRDAVEIGGQCDPRSHQCRAGACTSQGSCVAFSGVGELAGDGGCAWGLVDIGGRCRARRVRGEDCSYDDQCERGLLCLEQRCAPRLGRYELCDYRECGRGLVCDVDSSGGRTRCMPGRTWCTQETERCGEGYACAEPYGCRPCEGDECSAISTCPDDSHCQPGTECVALEAGRCEPTLCYGHALAHMFR